MPLWTDIIEPADLTGYARESLAAYEERQGSLARWIPNREVPDVEVRFVSGQSGLVEEARWRAYDAEPEVGKQQPAKRTIIELPALGQTIPVSEYQQLRQRNADDDTMLNQMLSTTDTVVRAIADTVERLRGTVINSGKATIAQDNFASDDDFGRDPTHDVTAAALWNTATVDRLADLDAWVDIYRTTNGEDPGALVMSNRVFRALASGDQFRLQLVNGTSRPATEADVNAIVTGAGLPPIVRYDRKTKSGRVTPDNRLYLLPAAVGTMSWTETQLGATFWGQTLTASLPEFQLAASEQPGIVVGAYRNEKPPAIAEIVSDAIALPVLANANLSFAATVL